MADQPAVAMLPSNHAPIELSDDESDVDQERRDADQGHQQKRQRLEASHQGEAFLKSGLTPAEASNVARNNNMPGWMNDPAALQRLQRQQQTGVSVSTTAAYGAASAPSRVGNGGYPAPPQNTQQQQQQYVPPILSREVKQHAPRYFEIPSSFVPTWDKPLHPQAYRRPTERRKFLLSLVNVTEFTITGLPVGYDGPPSALTGLRKRIKEVSKEHGKATFERNTDGSEGRWRIPLGAYRSFFSYLNSDPACEVVGIPESQLKIASLGKARLEKGYPSSKKLISMGVPRGLASALAPFQRGGVDFVVEKEGRALIADEMGLGKTIQAIASMSVYHQDWPVLVLTPSSARYHWENEFQHWLGLNSPINTAPQEKLNFSGEAEQEEEEEDENETTEEINCMTLLEDDQVHVLTSGRDIIFPSDRTRVVVCSFGLAPILVASGKLYPGLFGAAIVDESHMLKNMNTKRTKSLVPVLNATSRVVLLSGTPAFAKPNELWPQLKIISTEKTGWWEQEEEFQRKYVKNTSAVRRAELHAMLTGTVMIRRLKNDILKSLPRKIRTKGVVDVSTPALRKEFHSCMAALREGKGQLGMLARQHSALAPGDDHALDQGETNAAQHDLATQNAEAALREEAEQRLKDGTRLIEYTLATSNTALNPQEREQWKAQRLIELQQELDVWYRENLQKITEGSKNSEPEKSRKSVLNEMYTLTGRAKLDLVSDMLQRWLQDTTKGKLCVFAHHIFMLDEIIRRAGLSNEAGSSSKYIRIDGSTNPKERQAQMKAFQTDPSIRIAILGITAAGVAVTLTASATVWFTELFWTPALMIQAEDRCHRIGQNSSVNCMYFVATGTLDELLWKLLEKKFRDLGEFVEGKEKQEIVVDRVYHGVRELRSMFNTIDEDDEAIFDFGDSDGEDDGELLQLEHDLEDDIALLGQEELTMIRVDGDEEDLDDQKAEVLEVKGSSTAPVAGSTEEDAILLSDDENDLPQQSEPEAKAPLSDQANQNDQKPAATSKTQTFDFNGPLADCRGYSIMFEGSSFGIQMFMYGGRALVGGKYNGEYDRPAVADVLVAINGQSLPLLNDLKTVTDFMKQSIARSHVELTFVEIPALSRQIQMKFDQARKRQAELQAKLATKISNGPEDVIELLDDD